MTARTYDSNGKNRGNGRSGELVGKRVWQSWSGKTFGILPLRQAQGQDDGKNLRQQRKRTYSSKGQEQRQRQELGKRQEQDAGVLRFAQNDESFEERFDESFEDFEESMAALGVARLGEII